MRAVVVTSPHEMSVEERPEVSPEPGEVVVEVRACGVCGTDAHILAGHYDAHYPIVPGHEFAGVVVEAGEEINDLAEGDPVVVQPNTTCGKCRFCSQGRRHLCTDLRAYGVHLPGGMAERCVVDRRNIVRADGLSPSIACFAEPLACCLHGLQVLPPRPGDHVLLCGCGPIGLLLLQLLYSSGAAAVIASDLSEEKRRLALDLGASEALHPDDLPGYVAETHPDGFDMTVDATGRTEVIRQLISWCRNGGRILCYGVCPPDASLTIHPYELFSRELTMAGAFSLNHEMPAAIELLRARRIDVERLVSHRWPLDRAEEALRMKERPGDCLKIVLEPSPKEP